MAINLSQQAKKQRSPAYLIIVLLILIVGIGFAVWFFAKPKALENNSSSVVNNSLKKFEINFDILDNPSFDRLNNFEKVELFNGQMGRDNPFKPY